MLVQKIYDEIYGHLQAALPKEACGVIAKIKNEIKYIRAENLADNNDDFILDPSCLEYVDDINGKVLYIVHTHPRSSCQPSSSDLQSIEEHGYPWIIMDSNKQVSITRPPCGPLLGREFNYGVADCLALVVDYYKTKFNVQIQEVPRFSTHWWSDFGMDFNQLLAQYTEFEIVNNIKEHDILIMKLTEKIPNHFAIYVGSGKIMHHAVGRLSVIENLSPDDFKNITHILRRKEDV